MFKSLARFLKKQHKMLNKQNIIVQAVVYISLYLGIRYVLKEIVWKNINHNMLEGFDKSQADSFVLFHMNGCPHCVDMMGEWDSFTSSYDGPVRIKKIEKSQIASSEYKDVNVKGFPTMKVFDSSKKEIGTYNGQRKAVDFKSFLE